MAAPGERLAGRYQLIAPIGAGGMAVVWRATDLRLARQVAVKLLRPALADDPEVVRRFEQEARNAASLMHPNVATVLDTGRHGDDHYIVMELVDGPSVAELLRARGPLPAPLAVEIAASAARALAAAHRRGIVHRDVKPANLLVARDGTVRLADFGIARALATSRATDPGVVLGSIPYLSPEQARGEDATAAGDVYSLGVVLFELLTGRLPWQADTPAALATVRLEAPPDRPSLVRAGLPPGLDAVVGRALEIDPARRYPSARALAETLETWLREFARTAPVTGPDLAETVTVEVPAQAGMPTGASDPVLPPPPPGVTLDRTARQREPDPVRRSRSAVAGRHQRAAAPGAIEPGEPGSSRAVSVLATAAALLVLVGFLGGALLASGPSGGVLGESGTPGPGSPAAGASPARGATASGAEATPDSPPEPDRPTSEPTADPAAPTPEPTVTPAEPSPEPIATPTPESRPRRTPRPTPAPTATPEAARRPPANTAAARAVADFYDAVEAGDWDRAVSRWSPRMQAAYPPDEWLIGRFRSTTRIDLIELRTSAIDRQAGTATVAVDLVEYRSVEPSPRRFVGAWELVRIDGRWLLDEPRF